MEDINIIHGDMRERLVELDDDSVDLLLTDPPYNISTDFVLNRGDSGKYQGKAISSDKGEWDHGEIYPGDWLEGIDRKLTENAVLVVFYDTLDLASVIRPMETLGYEVRQLVAWHKLNPPPQGYGVKWQNALELGVIATVNEGQGHHYQRDAGQRHNIIKAPVVGGDGRFDHPTQKPVRLFEEIMRWWSEPGDLVLDPFAGTGTTGVAARKHGRRATLIEKEEEFVEMMRERLDTESGGAGETDW